jgi:thiol-disulfide isomerase/thioredoxin
MTKSFLLSIAFMFVITLTIAQTAMQFSGISCQGDSVDLFADLDSGKAVLLHFFMPNCGTCPPPAQKIQKMANKINSVFPGKVKGYAFPFENSYSCIVASNWVATSNVSTLYTPMDSGEVQVAYYGGFGMPTVVLLGGVDHRVLFSTQSFSSSDTTILRDSILAMFGTANSIQDLQEGVNPFSLYPNPANDNVSITFTLTETSDYSIDITDITGKQVAVISEEKKIGVVARQISTAALPSGNYIFRIRVNEKAATQKFVISH